MKNGKIFKHVGIFFVILLFSFVFVSGQTGLGVPTPYPISPLYSVSISPVNNYPHALEHVDIQGDGKDEIAYAFGNNVRILNGVNGNVLYSFLVPTGVFSISGFGDITGDGGSELAIASANGLVYIYTFTTVGPSVVTVLGPFPISYPFISLASMGDVTSDSIPDLAIGVPSANTFNAPPIFAQGTVYIYDVFNTVINANLPPVTTILAQSAVTTTSTTIGFFGNSITAIGDITGDGFSDLLISDPYTNGGIGEAWVFSSQGNYLNTFIGNPTNVPSGFGFDIDGGFDYNIDGTPDFVIGDSNARNVAFSQVGAVHVYSGVNFNLIATILGTSPTSSSGPGGFGSDIEVGDINGDGRGDLLVYDSSPTIPTLTQRVSVYNFPNNLLYRWTYTNPSGIANIIFFIGI